MCVMSKNNILVSTYIYGTKTIQKVGSLYYYLIRQSGEGDNFPDEVGPRDQALTNITELKKNT